MPYETATRIFDASALDDGNLATAKRIRSKDIAVTGAEIALNFTAERGCLFELSS